MISREGARHLPGDNQERKPRPAFTETLKRQFREMVKAITDKPRPREPTQPRRRTEDTGRAAFRMAARKIMRRAVRIPAAAYAAATYLWDTLDWLNPWQNDTASTSELAEDFHYCGAKSSFPAPLAVLARLHVQQQYTNAHRFCHEREGKKHGRWLEIGTARQDSSGVIHAFLDRTPIGGFNGYVYFAPVGTNRHSPNRSGPPHIRTPRTRFSVFRRFRPPESAQFSTVRNDCAMPHQ